MDKKQATFGVVILGVAILMSGVLAYGGYRLYTHLTKPASTANSQTGNSTSNTADPNAGYVVIKEWGVRFKPVSGLEGVEYALWSSGVNIGFTVEQLKGINVNCSAEKGALGTLYRLTMQASGIKTYLTKVGGYFYYYSGPQSTCSDPAHSDLELTMKNELAVSLKTLDASQ